MFFPTIENFSTVNVIILDIFNTLLIRPYVCHNDLYAHMGKIINVDFFLKKRIIAGKNYKRYKTYGEYSLEKLYDLYLPSFKKYLEIELELESNYVVYEPIFTLYDILKKNNKKIILMSNVELPRSFLKIILKTYGIDPNEQIFILSEFSSKYEKYSALSEILNDPIIKNKNIAYVGRGSYEDKRKMKQMGIRPFITKSLIDYYFQFHINEKKYYTKNKTLNRSIMVSLDAIYWMKNNFKKKTTWESISYRYGGPIVFDFCQYIHKNSNNQTIIYIARDGYNIKRVYETLFGHDQNSMYIHLPRIANVLTGNHYKTYKNYKSIIVTRLYPEETQTMTDEEKNIFFDKNENKILDIRNLIKKSLKDRIIKEIGEKNEITIVDVTTTNFSSQSLASELLPDCKINGIYYFTFDDSAHNYKTYAKTTFLNPNINVNLFEFFMSSPEPPVFSINKTGYPIFKEKSKFESNRISIYDSVTNGILNYSKDVQEIFKNNLPEFNYEDIYTWNNQIIFKKTEEHEKFKSIKWPVNISHEKYINVIFASEDIPYYIRKYCLDFVRNISKKIRKK